MSDSRRVYCKFCEQSYVTATSTNTCAACRKTGGLIDAASPAALKDYFAKKRERQKFKLRISPWLQVRLAMAGWVLILVGVLSLILPGIRADAEQLAFREWGYGLGVIATGVVLEGVVIYFAAKNAREDSLRDQGARSSAQDSTAPS